MRLYKVVVLINLAVGVGFLAGYHWWGQEAARLRRELEVAQRATRLSAGGGQTWGGSSGPSSRSGSSSSSRTRRFLAS